MFHVLRKFCAEKTGNCKTAINQQEHNIGARDPPSTFLQKRKMFHLWTGLTTDALIGLQPIVQSFCRTKSIEAFSDENSDLRISLVIVPHKNGQFEKRARIFYWSIAAIAIEFHADPYS